jgi:nucleoid-associated protein YgaU
METNRGNTFTSSVSDRFRFIDFFVLVFFLSTAFLGLYLFRNDLLRTIEARDVEPAGVIIIRNNIVQRRHDDRVLWDRIFVNSLVYPGDLIRAADFSSATINIDENKINLNENTIIRIQRLEDGEAPFEVELREGKLSVASGTDARIVMLNLLGRQVEIGPGTVINAESGEEGIVVEVSEGSAVFIEEGQKREQGRKITGGAMVAMDANGVEHAIPAAVVTSPPPNARYLKDRPENLLVDFSWNRINLAPEDRLRLEVSDDWNFVRISRSIDSFGSSAQIPFNSGRWYWRLLFGDKVLSRGQFTVLDGSGPALTSPVSGSRFRYDDKLPQMRFQWAEKQEASGYLVEISEAPDFENLKVTRQTKTASLILSELGEGTWYWRVKPLFLSISEGESDYSSVFYINIEQTKDTAAQVIEVPSSPVAVVPQPVRVRERPAERDRDRDNSRENANAGNSVSTVNNATVRDSASTVNNATVRDSTVNNTAVRDSSRADNTASTVNNTTVRESASTGNTASAVARNSAENAGRYHTVRPGDTLSRIARQFYGNAFLWERIASANKIQNPDLIYPDQVFVIP